MSNYFLFAIILAITASILAVFVRMKGRESIGNDREKALSADDFEILDISEQE